jgi:hypothetical protein
MADVLYTGKGLAANIPKDSGNAMARLGSFITRAEELKYQTFKQNEQEFLKASNIDPAFFISTANQATQSKLLDEFNKTWSAKMKASNNNLSLEDKQAMMAQKNLLIAQQQDMQTKQDLWQQHRNMIMQNPNKYDQEEWAVYDKVYRETGEYPLVTPPIKAQSIDMALQKNPITGEVIKQPPEYSTIGGIKMFADVTHTGTEENARQRVRDLALSDEAYTKDLARQFRELDPQTKLKYLDADKNGTISREEAQDFNPIIKWAQDTKWQSAIKVNKSPWKKIPSTSTKTSTFNWNSGIDVNHNLNDQYDRLTNIKQPTEFGVRTFPDLINLGSINQAATEAQPIDEIIDYSGDTPRRIKEVTNRRTGKKEDLADSVRFNIIGYSPSDDVIVVKIADDGSYFYQGQVIALPADKYSELLKRKPIGISREKFQAENKQTIPSAPISSGIKWR